jgi:hypothetical protein
MIPVFIVWLIARYRKSNAKKVTELNSGRSKKQLPPVASIFLITMLLFCETKGHSQNKILNYQIIRNGNKVGSLLFSETSIGELDYLKMESDVKARFIFTFTAHASEEAVYNNGVLLRSSIYRRLNGSEKANKQHQATNNRQYLIRTGDRSEVTKTYPITYNMLSLYSKEPENISKVYSDNFQTFLAIEKAASHKYKITLPDGNYNYYQYKKGVLNLVEVHHTLYSASIVLTN